MPGAGIGKTEAALVSCLVALLLVSSSFAFLYLQDETALKSSRAEVSSLQSELDTLRSELSMWSQQATNAQQNLTQLQQLLTNLQRQIFDLTGAFPWPAPSGGYDNVTITGGNAAAVCEAFLMPCPLNPTFQAKVYTIGNYTIYVVDMKINYVPYTFEMSAANSSEYCITPPINGAPMCP
jgi:hypothetical protein